MLGSTLKFDSLARRFCSMLYDSSATDIVLLYYLQTMMPFLSLRSLMT